MPRKYFLDVVTEQFLAQEFFSLHQEMFSYCKKKVLCQEKKILGPRKKKILRPRKKKIFARKKVISLHQENIFLESDISLQ